MTTPLTLDPVVWTAAILASGEEVSDAPPEARQLAAQALAVADRQAMDDIADHLDAEYVSSGQSGPRVSDVGACRRAVWYREQPPEGYEPLPEMYRRPATVGSVIHRAAEQARKVRYPWRFYELPVQVPGLDRPAKIDEYDPVLGEVTDDKTAGDWRWEQFGDEGPSDADWDQVGVYGLALESQGLPVRTLRIIAIRRENGDEEHFRRTYDPAAAQKALDRLVELATALDLGVVPPRDGVGPSSFPCKMCPARAHCWNMDAAAAAGRSPESYTVLGAEPDDPTIAWAAEQAVAAQTVKRDAAKAAKAADALLEGIEPGEYGDYEIRPRRRDMPDYKGSFTRLLDLYGLSEEYRPAVEDVSAPLLRVDRWTEVRRKRAAQRSKKKAGEQS